MKFTNKKLQAALSYLDKNNHHYDVYNGIAENGSDDTTTLLTTNWNNIPDKFTNWVESLCEDGVFETDYSDEYSYCNDCNKSVKTNPTHYGWQPYYIIDNESSIICVDCAKNDFDHVLDSYVNNNTKALFSHFLSNLNEKGFTCLSTDECYCQRFETGFHPDQNDNPKVVSKWVKNNLPEHDFIFLINSTGQFDVQWSCYIKPKSEE